MSDRRTFLCGLASLPLIGGSVAILGQPTAAAIPVTDTLIERYQLLLAIEVREALTECREQRCMREEHAEHAAVMREIKGRCIQAPDNPWILELLDAGGRPSSRAAIALAATWVDLTKGRRL